MAIKNWEKEKPWFDEVDATALQDLVGTIFRADFCLFEIDEIVTYSKDRSDWRIEATVLLGRDSSDREAGDEITISSSAVSADLENLINSLTGNADKYKS